MNHLIVGILFLSLGLSAFSFEKKEGFPRNLKTMEWKAAKENSKKCPSAITNVVEREDQVVVLLGQTSFTYAPDRKKQTFTHQKSPNYPCKESVTVKAGHSSLEKRIVVAQCSSKEKHLERVLIETLSLNSKGKLLRFTRNDSGAKNKGALKCVYFAK